MVPQCIPYRRFTSRDNRPGLAHFLRFYTFHCLPVLSTPGWFQHLAAATSRACVSHDLDVWGYAFLPDHVRLLIKPRRPQYDLRKFISDLKQGCEKAIVTESPKQYLRVLRVRNELGHAEYRLWQQGTGPIEAIADAQAAAAKRNLCHAAPVECAVAASDAGWQWSSLQWANGIRTNDPLPMATWEADWHVESERTRASMLH